MVGLIAHTPEHYTRMVTVATDHLFQLLFLNLRRKILVLNIWDFLINCNSEFISQIVNKSVIGIMCCSHEVIIQVFSYISIIHQCDPFWNGITKPWIFLVTVSSMYQHFFTVHIQEVFFIIPPEPTKTKRA